MMIRDDYERGVRKEYELKQVIVDTCRLACKKNDDKYDIDLVITLSKNKKILIEIEETSKRFWPTNNWKPQFPSGLFTMPIRKVKYFIADFKKLEKTYIKSIENFIKLYPKSTLFKPRSSKDEIRLYIKGSYNLKYLCMVKENIIVNSLNHNLKDQKFVDAHIKELKKRSSKWRFYRNLWYNPLVRNMKGKQRDDPGLLILGLINKDNNLIWIEKSDLCCIFNELIKTKWGT